MKLTKRQIEVNARDFLALSSVEPGETIDREQLADRMAVCCDSADIEVLAQRIEELAKGQLKEETEMKTVTALERSLRCIESLSSKKYLVLSNVAAINDTLTIIHSHALNSLRLLGSEIERKEAR